MVVEEQLAEYVVIDDGDHWIVRGPTFPVRSISGEIETFAHVIGTKFFAREDAVRAANLLNSTQTETDN